MEKIIKISYLCLVIVLISCTKQNKRNQNETLGIPEVIKPKQIDNILTSEFLDSISYISLDSKIILGDVTDLIYRKGRFYIKDGITETLNVFDKNGTFLFKIDDVGKGPGEYTEITDFYVADNYIVLLCRPSKRIIRYSLDKGKSLDMQIIEDYLNGIRPIENGYLTYSKDGYKDYGRPSGLSFLEISQIGLENKSLHAFGGSYAQYIMSQTKYFSEGEDDSSLLLSASDTVFSYKNGVVKSKYRFDFGKRGISDEYRKLKHIPDNMEILRKKGFVIYKDYLVETKNFTFLNFRFGLNPNTMFLLNDKKTNTSLFSPSIANDMGLFPYTFPKYKKDKEEVISVLNVNNFKNSLNTFKEIKHDIVKAYGIDKYEKKLKELNQIVANKNPVLAIGYLKTFHNNIKN